MRVAETGLRIRKRRKLTAGLVGAGLLVTVVVVAAAYWRGRARFDQPAIVAQPVPQDVNQQLAGYSFTRSDGGRRVFTIRAARTVALKDGGETILEDVVVEFFGRDGSRHDMLRTHRCDYSPRSGNFSTTGQVEIELNSPELVPLGGKLRGQPVYLQTSAVSYQQQGGVVESSKPVTFRLGPVVGSARGMTYATRDEWVELKQDVALAMKVQESAPPLGLTAVRLRYDKARGNMNVTGPLTITQGTRQVRASRGRVTLDAENRVRAAVLEGDVRGQETSPDILLTARAERVQIDFDPAARQPSRIVAEGPLEAQSNRGRTTTSLRAEMSEVSFSGIPARPEKGILRGKVLIKSVARGVSSGEVARETNQATETRELTAAEVHYVLRREDGSLRQAQALGSPRLVLTPADGKSGDRLLTADEILMLFDPGNRINQLRGTGRARLMLQPPAGSRARTPAKESQSETIVATFDPISQDLRMVEQLGNVRMIEGDRQARAERAHYVAAKELLTLTGDPRLWDVQTRVQAQQVRLDFRGNTAEGRGKVRSTHWPEREQREGTQARASSAESINVLADRVLILRDRQVVRYEGQVRAWRGQDVVESSALEIDQQERRVSFGRNVVTALFQRVPATEKSGLPRGKSEKQPVTIRADYLDYLDLGQKAIYRGRAELRTQDTVLQSDRLEVLFADGARGENTEVTRAVASGHVRVTQPLRRASGEQAEYDASRGEITLTGGQPALEDAQRGFIQGQRLTFFVRDDTLRVDGGETEPTITQHRLMR